MNEPIHIEITDRDGGTIRTEEFESVDEMLNEWPYAMQDSQGNWSSWIGGKS